jgi:hypothetical protein
MYSNRLRQKEFRGVSKETADLAIWPPFGRETGALFDASSVRSGAQNADRFRLRASAVLAFEFEPSRHCRQGRRRQASDDPTSAAQTTEVARRSFPDANLAGPHDRVDAVERCWRQAARPGNERSLEVGWPSRPIRRIQPVENGRRGDHCRVFWRTGLERGGEAGGGRKATDCRRSEIARRSAVLRRGTWRLLTRWQSDYKIAPLRREG